MQHKMVLNEPHISTDDLQKITAPTLIVAGDNDAIPLSHIMEIVGGIPHAQLAILPGATHDLFHGEYDLYNFIASRLVKKFNGLAQRDSSVLGRFGDWGLPPLLA